MRTAITHTVRGSRWAPAAAVVLATLTGAAGAASAADRLTQEEQAGSPPAAGAAAAQAAPLSAARFAVVDDAGRLVRGRNAISSRRTALGVYEVTFDRNIAGCAFVGSLGAPSGGLPPTGQLSVTQAAQQPRNVFVATRASNGVQGDRSFHLTVVC